jgi:predicted  nucleic acid-binding Zn-ribbon protein
MSPETLANRVAILEHKMQSLEELPERVASLEGRVASLEGQVLQFRAEVRVEFSAVREEMRAGDEETRRQMRVLHEEVIARFALLDEHLDAWKRSPESRGRTGSSRRSPKR